MKSNYDKAVEFIGTLGSGTEFIGGYHFDGDSLARMLGIHYEEGRSIAKRLLKNSLIEKDPYRDGKYRTL